MDPTHIAPRRRLIIAIITAVLVLALVLGMGIYGLIRGAPTTDPRVSGAPPTPAPITPGSAPSTPGPAPSMSAPPRTLRTTSDSEVFARAVATALFSWDTASGHEPADYAQVLLDVGDPTGSEASGLASDVRSFLPSPQAWAQLRTHQTRQWLIIDALEVPASWALAEAQAAPGQLLPGTTAYTITGTRHRTGTWGTEPMHTERPVSFTIFLACEPSFNVCRLLRLSGLDNPLS